MSRPGAIGIALGNVPLQDQLCEILSLHAGREVRACRTDAELEVLLAGCVLDGVVLGPRLVGLQRRVLPAVERAGCRQRCWCPRPPSRRTRPGWPESRTCGCCQIRSGSLSSARHLCRRVPQCCSGRCNQPSLIVC